MLSVGLDIATRSHEATILDETGSPPAPSLKCATTVEGVQALLARVKGYEQPVSFAHEAAGHYWLALFERPTRSGRALTNFNLF